MSPRPFDAGETSIHVRRAVDGDAQAVSWLVDRFTPALLLLAERRMGPLARAAATPEDVVQQVWLTALRRLPEFDRDGGFAAARVVKFLTTVLLHHVRDLCARQVRRGSAPSGPPGGPEASPASGGVSAIADSASAVLTRILRGERGSALRAALGELDETDREVVVRRAFEDESCDDIASDLGLAANTVVQRFRRALAKLRASLPKSVFAELEDETGGA